MLDVSYGWGEPQTSQAGSGSRKMLIPSMGQAPISASSVALGDVSKLKSSVQRARPEATESTVGRVPREQNQRVSRGCVPPPRRGLWSGISGAVHPCVSDTFEGKYLLQVPCLCSTMTQPAQAGAGHWPLVSQTLGSRHS